MKWLRIRNILFREFPIYYLSRVIDILPNHGITCAIRGRIVANFFLKHGSNFQLAQGGIFNYPENIEVGNNVYIAHRAYINATFGLKIDDNVSIGPNCIIATGNHSLNNGKVLNEGLGGLITIGKGTWIGGNVTITEGVNIGEGCIIGAGSVVTKNIEDNCMVGGVPANMIKKIN